MEGLIEGRIVHYVPTDIDAFRFPEEHRPAMIVRIWRGAHGLPGDCVNLQVFIDGSNDIPNCADRSAVWRTSVNYSAEKLPGTWHWIERDVIAEMRAASAVV